MAGNMDDPPSDVVDVGDNNPYSPLSGINTTIARAVNCPYQGIVGTPRLATQTSDGTTQRPSAETDQGMQVTVTSTIHQVSPRLTTCSSTTVPNISVASVDTLHQNQQHPLLRTWTASTWPASNAQAIISSMPPQTADYGQLRTDLTFNPWPPADAFGSHFYSYTHPSLPNHLQQRYFPSSASPNIGTYYRFSTQNSSALALPQTASLQSISNLYDGVSTVVSTSAAAVGAPHSHTVPSSFAFTLSHVPNTIPSVCYMPTSPAEPSSYSQLQTSQLPTILPNCSTSSVDPMYSSNYGNSHAALRHFIQQRTNYRYDINDQAHRLPTASNSSPMAQPPIKRRKRMSAMYQNTSTQSLEMDTVRLNAQCPFCYRLFPKPQNARHMQKCRASHSLLECAEENCREIFANRKLLIRHILHSHHYRLVCHLCLRKFVSQCDLNDHQTMKANSCYVPPVTFPVSRAPHSTESLSTWVISSGSATQHTTTSTQPTATSAQPTTTSTQPTTTSTQPTITSTQPTTTSTQPTTTSTQPTATSTQPAATSTQPATTSTQPTTTSTQPTATDMDNLLDITCSAARRGNEEGETDSYALGYESPAGGTATASRIESAPYGLSSPVHLVIDTFEGPIQQQPLPLASADDALEEYLAKKKSSADNVMSQTSSQQRQQVLIDEEQDVIHVCPHCCESIVDDTHICALQPS